MAETILVGEDLDNSAPIDVKEGKCERASKHESGSSKKIRITSKKKGDICRKIFKRNSELNRHKALAQQGWKLRGSSKVLSVLVHHWIF